MSHVILLALAPIFFVMVLGYVAGRFHQFFGTETPAFTPGSKCRS